MKKPLGKIYSSIHQITIPEGRRFVTVGDRISYNSVSSGLRPNLIIYDGKERRDFLKIEMKALLDRYCPDGAVVSNPPGYITDDIWKSVKKSLTKNYFKILVIGEEDLTAIPVFMTYPDETIVLYGQPDVGIVEVEINEKLKNKLKELLDL